MNKEKIKRINFLARKSKEQGLTDEEKEEQKLLRDEYRAEFRQSLTSQLDNTYYFDENGEKKRVAKKTNNTNDIQEGKK